MKSIIQDESCKVCYLCGGYGSDRHHCLHGTANRKKADEDGLTVMLCHDCHMKLHDTGLNDRYLQRQAETRWIEHYKSSIEEFIKRYGKNYL